MKFIDGQGVTLGRLASYVAKEALKGEEIKVFNCDQVIITGNKKFTEERFNEQRGRVGTIQKGPKHSATSERIVKRTIRGMLPNYRTGRGAEALSKVRCYVGIPKEFSDVKPVSVLKQNKIKYSLVKEFTKKQ